MLGEARKKNAKNVLESAFYQGKRLLREITFLITNTSQLLKSVLF